MRKGMRLGSIAKGVNTGKISRTKRSSIYVFSSAVSSLRLRIWIPSSQRNEDVAA